MIDSMGHSTSTRFIWNNCQYTHRRRVRAHLLQPPPRSGRGGHERGPDRHRNHSRAAARAAAAILLHTTTPTNTTRRRRAHPAAEAPAPRARRGERALPLAARRPPPLSGPGRLFLQVQGKRGSGPYIHIPCHRNSEILINGDPPIGVRVYAQEGALLSTEPFDAVWEIGPKLGSGAFATVHKCIEKVYICILFFFKARPIRLLLGAPPPIISIEFDPFISILTPLSGDQDARGGEGV